jgi:hypothetical protein
MTTTSGYVFKAPTPCNKFAPCLLDAVSPDWCATLSGLCSGAYLIKNIGEIRNQKSSQDPEIVRDLPTQEDRCFRFYALTHGDRTLCRTLKHDHCRDALDDTNHLVRRRYRLAPCAMAPIVIQPSIRLLDAANQL